MSSLLSKSQVAGNSSLQAIAQQVRSHVLDVPREVVAAAQPYSTVSGPALTVSFLSNPSLLAFQRLPFHHSIVPGTYFHALLDSLAEFCETPRTQSSKLRDVQLMTAPLPHFWDEVGQLSSAYSTMYFDNGANVSTHPSMGAVELCRSTSRSPKDVRITLYDSAYKPMAAMLLTGPRTSPGAGDSSSGMLKREMLPPSKETVGSDDIAVTSEPCSTTQSCFAGLVVKLPDGSLAQQGMFPSATAAPHAQSEGVTVAPPWLLHDTVSQFCQSLCEQGCIASSCRTWCVAAYHAHSPNDIILGEGFDIVSAPPKHFARYRLPPWRHRIGLPDVHSHNMECVALKVEFRQSGRVAYEGVFYLVPMKNSTTSY